MNPVHKGKRGENEFCKFLEFYFSDLIKNKIERNYNQADGESGDVDSLLPYFIFEVKRQESLSLDSWWRQVKHAAIRYEEKNEHYAMPIVAYRQNRKSWEFLLPASLIGLDGGFLHVEKNVFIDFARNYIVGNLNEKS